MAGPSLKTVHPLSMYMLKHSTREPHMRKKNFLCWLLLLIRVQMGILIATNPVCAQPVASNPGQPEPSHNFVIQIRYDPLLCPRILVDVSINEAAPLSFLVDTGSNVGLVVDKWAAEKLGLKPTGKTFSTERSGVMDITRIRSFQFSNIGGDLNPKSYEVPVYEGAIGDLHYPPDLMAGRRIAGIIGIPILGFGNRAIRFDLDRHIMTLLKQEPTVGEGTGTAVLPLQKRDNQFFVSTVMDNGKPVDMLVDTGAEGVFVPSDLIDRFVIVPTPPVYEARMFSEGVRFVKVRQIAHFPLGTFIEPDVVLHETQRDKALLGLPLLARFQFTLDFVHNRLLLERASSYARGIRLPGATSIVLTQHNQAVWADDVIKDTHAEQTGIHPNDEIVEIDHLAVKDLTLSVAQNVLDGMADTLATVIIRRDGKLHTFTFQRQSLFAYASGAPVGVGIGFENSPDGHVLAGAILKHSPAEEAGIQEGDEIISINDQLLRNTPLSIIAKRLHQPEGTEITLEIQHKGEDKPREVKLKVRKLL